MVNSGSFDAAGSEGESGKAEFTQLEDDAAEANFTAVVPSAAAAAETAVLDTLPDKPTKTCLQCSVPLDKVKNVLELCNNKSKLNNYFILESYLKQKSNELTTEMPESSSELVQKPAVKRLMCLFCDRTFASNNLKQKHVDRCHSTGHTRRSSSRTPNHNQSATACCFCSKLNHTDHTLKQLLEHLINEHSNRYFACLSCQERFNSVQSLRDHNRLVHGIQDTVESKPSTPSPVATETTSSNKETTTVLLVSEVIRPELKRTCSNDSTSKSENVLPPSPKENSSPSNLLTTKQAKRISPVKNIPTPDTKDPKNDDEKSAGFHEDFEDAIHANVISQEETIKLKAPEVDDEDLVLTRRAKNGAVNSKTKNTNKKNLIVNKKIGVKSTKNGVRNNLRTTRATVKQVNNNLIKTRKNKVVKNESESNKQIVTKKSESNPASVFSLVNAYTYKYEKIYDHASDSIKDANSGHFNAVFDREFYTRTVCNIRDNLLHHLDGKLNRNIESESRISNFEHNAIVAETETKPANETVDNFGCDLSLNAVTPVATLLGSSQYGEDFDAQIEYGAKASQKKQKKVAVVKYKFPNKKYNSLFREKDSHNDLTYLDMWTQLSVKKRQHKFTDDCSFSEDLIHYLRPTGEATHQVDELNRILDTRGPFEDLRKEANAAQFLELRKKSVKDGDNISEEASKDVYFVLEDLLNRVMCKCSENTIMKTETDVVEIKENDETKIESKEEVSPDMELPSYLQLQKSPSDSNDFKIDNTDSIALICSSQDENEMKEKKRLELSGEWARPRIYICATCGLKLPNLKSLDDHKNMNHTHIWCSHYEFVGNQSQIYRHLCIPGLGKVGVVEMLPVNRLWQRSDARMCSKCSKSCHNLGELHKHILECGGDWTWMLARKKCKYRPYGARTRRRRQRGYKRSCNPEVNRAREHKPKIKPIFIGPRPKPSKPSDAETIERMLANLPPKRNRKMISMRDGIQRPRKPYKQKLNNQSSPNSQSNLSPKSPNKKVHFKNNSPQVTKQTLRNALKRKMSAKNLRKQNNTDIETDSSDTPLKLRSRVKKGNKDTDNTATINENDVTQQLIGKRTKIRNKRMISRILGSKIFDTNSALVTRRKLVKAITQNNLIRKTRLRSKMNVQQSSNNQKEVESAGEVEEKLLTKAKALQENDKNSDKKTKIHPKNLNKTDEINSKLIKNNVSNLKNSESDPKTTKKSKNKRFLSMLTKTNKNTKVPTTTDTNKPDTISAVIDEVIKRASKEESLRIEKIETKEKTGDKNIRRTRSSSSLLIVDPNEIKNNKVEEILENKSDGNKDETKNVTNKEYDSKTEKVLGKKTNKLVQKVKSFRKSFRKPNKNKSEKKSEGIASKLTRTFSMKSSKKKTSAKNETKAEKLSPSSVTVDQEIDLKKTTTDISNQSKEPENETKTTNLETVVTPCDKNDSECKTNDSEVMPTLEKIEPLPSNVPLSTSVNSIPILCPVNVDPSCENNVASNLEEQKETKSDSDVCSEVSEVSDNKTDLTSCDKSSANNCNYTFNKFKSKIKRSGRGLNDCIAMLKCKLEQKNPFDEPSLVDKSNLFILNSSEVIKHSQPVVQEKVEITPSSSVDSTKINEDTLTNNDQENATSSINLKDSVENKSSENENINELVNEPKTPEVKSVNVLEIPSVKINSKSDVSTSEMSTVETQTQTVDEDIVPNAAIDYTSIPTNLQSNFQLSYVLNATLQNCLMECIKNKCDELKTENQNYPLNLKSNQNKSGTKIGSVRKRTTRKPQIKKNVVEKEKHIPNIPVLLNTAFTEKSTPNKIKSKTNLDPTTNSIKAASDTSDDDIPLSKFVSDSPSCTKLKIKLPVAKKKRSSKKHIAFTPLILNNQDSCIPQISLQDRIEQRISLDNSMNDKIEAIQMEVAATKDEINNDTPIAKDINNEIIENKINYDEIRTEINSEEEIVTVNTDKVTKERNKNEICDNIPVDLSNKKEPCHTDVLNETIKILSENSEEQLEKLNNEIPVVTFNIEEQIIMNKESTKLEDSNKEVLQANSVNHGVSKSEEINNEVKASPVTKEVIDSLHPLSQQIMTMEDEPCDSFLINKTLTEANIKPPTPTKNVFQSNSSSENIEFINKINHFDSGKENTECQKIKKQRKVIKKQKAKRKRGRSKAVNQQADFSETIADLSATTELDQSTEKVEDEICNTSAEGMHQETNEIHTDNFKSLLQLSFENESEPSLMENKNIQEIQINIDKLSTPLDQSVSSSDSEDELPLAVLLKTKKSLSTDSPTVEDGTKLDQSEFDYYEKEFTDIPELDNTVEDIIANDVCTIEENTLNIEVALNKADDSSNKNDIVNNIITVTEKLQIFQNTIDENVLHSVENDKDISCVNNEVQQEIKEFISIDENITEIIGKEDENKMSEAVTDYIETAEKDDTSSRFLETHFDVENNTETSVIDSENVATENYQDDQAENKTPESTEKSGEELFDFLKTPSNKHASDTDSSFITTPDLADKSLVIKIKTNLKIKIRKPKKSRSRVIPKSLSKNNVRRKEKEEEETNVAIICDICNKTFKRKENLASHKKTLTHIAKLSEIEARESMARRLNEQEENNDDEPTKEQENQENKNFANMSIENDKEKNIVQDDIHNEVNQISEELEPETVNNLEQPNASTEPENVEPEETAAENEEINLQEPDNDQQLNIVSTSHQEMHLQELCNYQQLDIVTSPNQEINLQDSCNYQPDIVEVENNKINLQEPENDEQPDIVEIENNLQVPDNYQQLDIIAPANQENNLQETCYYQQPDSDSAENNEIHLQEPENYKQNENYQQLSPRPEIVTTENKEINLEEPNNYKQDDIIELDDDETEVNEIKDDVIQSNKETSHVHIIHMEEKEIIEIDDDSSADSQPVIVTENFVNNNEPEIARPIEEILDLEPQKPNTNLLPGLIVSSKNSNLKLVDIISQVLDKPVNDLHIGDAHYHPQNITRSSNNCDSNDTYSEPKRYKSLGERKSFDSEHFNLPPKNSDESIKENYNTSLGSVNNGLLSKQLSLLENIIEETNPNLNYIDDSISLSSSQFDEPVEQNISEKDLFKPDYTKLSAPQIKFSHNADVLSSFIKPNNHFNNFGNISETFTKPAKQKFGEATESTFEEEQRKKTTKDNTKRKILNRDEELFLECCSLLKSGSEISAASKKSTRNIPLNNFSRSNDASWIIQKQPNSDQFIQRDSYSWLAQSSRVDTPIGEPFVNNDWSNSNSAVSSEWLAQKAPSPDRPTENNTLMKKSNNNSGETKYSDIQFEDISIDTSLETSKTLMAVDNSNNENIPLDFHHVNFSNKNIIENPEVTHQKFQEELKENSVVEINESSENTATSNKEQEIYAIQEKQDIDDDEPELKIDEDVPNREEIDSDLKKKVVSAFGGLMAKALSNRLHAVVRKSKKSKGKRDFASAIQASITDYAVPVKKNKLNHTDSDSNDCPKKLMTKGAMKVFEGLKVSIPTQDLNLKEVLNCSNKPKNGETIEPVNEAMKNGEIKEDAILEKSSEKAVEKNGKLKNLFGRFGNKLGLRETKKKSNKHRNKSKNHTNNKKSHDVYEFEESMDSNFMFKTGKFSLFRNKEQNFEKTANIEIIKEIAEVKIDDTKLNHESGISSLKWNGNESDSDTDRYYDSMSFEEMSISSESMQVSDPTLNKTKPVQKKNSEKSKENQKKCMIMGRIFKNASKPKLEDKIPEIRDISSEENSKLAGNYVDSYSSVDNVEKVVHHEVPTVPNNFTVVNNSANKMSKIEMDLLFDKLLEEEKKHTENNISSSVLSVEKEQPNEEIVDLPLSLPVDKIHTEKKKVKEGKTKTLGKTKKRQRHNSGDSTSSDEFTLSGRHSKSTKKHHKTSRKSTKPKKETGINLEQEMKECIGVAGRKSQRKCTSGKQNVLIEFWSSDESSFEEVIKMLAKESEPTAPIEQEKKTENIEEFPPPEPEELLENNSSLSNSNQDLPNSEFIENTLKNNIDIYEFDSDTEPKQDHLKIKIKLNEPIPKPETEFIASTKIRIPKKTKRIGKSRKHSKSHGEESDDTEFETERNRKREHRRKKNVENGDELGPDSNPECLAVTRKKRNAGDQLYYWSSSSDDEFQDLIEVKPIREDTDDDRPMQHGWIVGDSPKKLVTMLAQAKGKKVEGESVKEQGKKNRVTL